MNDPRFNFTGRLVAGTDAEIDAIATCLRALLPLDLRSRNRVLEYLDDRLQKAEQPAAQDDPDE